MAESRVSNDGNISQPSQDSAELLDSLQSRAERLLSELKSYQECLRVNEQYGQVEIRTFVRGLEAEFKTLDSITKKNSLYEGRPNHNQDSTEDIESTQQHTIRSSNLVHYEAVWSVARKCRRILALNKKVYWTSSSADSDEQHPTTGRGTGRRRGSSVVIDIIANDGLEWVKVSTISERRLIFEIAKEGWCGYDDESDESDNSNDKPGAHSQDGKLEIVRLAEHMRQASQATRVNFRHPQIRFVLPRIIEGSQKDIDLVIADLRKTGAIVECGAQSNGLTAQTRTKVEISENCLDEQPDLALEKLLPSSSIFSPTLTSTLNIDCTILLALISDISHLSFPSIPSPNTSSNHNAKPDISLDQNARLRPYHIAIRRQIIGEQSQPLLPHDLYPILLHHDLECTSPAAKRMREIVATMGTKDEAKRAQILFAEENYRDMGSKELIRELRQISIHPVPENLRLPIKVIDFDGSSILNDEAESIEKEQNFAVPPFFPISTARATTQALNLSRINTSVFLYGWIKDLVTVTSNRVVAMGLVKTINSVLDKEEAEARISGDNDGQNAVFRGPKIHVCEIARSLIGKDKPKLPVVDNSTP